MGTIVLLYMYDLSGGWCSNLGPLCPVNAVWHTSIVIYDKEYVFGNTGIKFHDPVSCHLFNTLDYKYFIGETRQNS